MQNRVDLYLRVNGRTLVLAPEDSAGTVHLCSPRFGGEIRVEMAHGIFSADALCAAAFVQAVRRGARERCVVMVESGGLAGILPVMVDPATGKVAAGIPIPEIARIGDTAKLQFPGLICCVGTNPRGLFDGDSAVLLVERNAECSFVSARGRLNADEPFSVFPASGIAAAAAAIDYAAAQLDGITEYEIGMEGGEIGIGVVMRGGVLSGLSVSSVVVWDTEAGDGL